MHVDLKTFEEMKEALNHAKQEARKTAQLLVRRDIEMREINDELQKVNQAKSEFVALAAHQLRTPVSTMAWYSEFLLDNPDLPKEKCREYMRQINETGRQMGELIDTLLMMSALEMNTRDRKEEVFTLDEVVQHVISNNVSVTKDTKITTKVDITTDMEVMTDRSMFQAIFQNLYSNAVKYSPQDGEVTIHAEKIEKGGRFGDKVIPAESLGISVSDQGVGIPAEQQQYVFSRLFRADNVIDMKIKGTGLGLYIVKLVVDHFLGSIWFSSKENEGTTFYVTIPLSLISKN